MTDPSDASPEYDSIFNHTETVVQHVEANVTVWAWIASYHSSRTSAWGSLSSSNSEYPNIIVIGVRISWDAIVMKSSFRSNSKRSSSRVSLSSAFWKSTPTDLATASRRETFS